MRGLSLTRDEVCQELGSQSCIRGVHTVALGGNDPFGSGLLRPPAASLSTTPLAIDRVTLSACSQRARADKQGSPEVSPLVKGNRVFGGVDPKTCLTYGFDRATGDPKRDVIFEEAALYGALAHVLDIDYAGREDCPILLRG